MSTGIDPILLRVTAGALAAACEEMGELLVRTARSPNIKERRDCSTGLFDARGRMAMQAEHIPVHLGAMPASVAAITRMDVRPGDAWIVNDPFDGGTHLPDITLVLPVHDDLGELLGYAAARAHHADVGGPTPGSMPAHSTSIEQEGVVIPPTRIGAGDRLDEALLDRLVSGMRGAGQRRADLVAQIAACRRGGLRLDELATRLGRPQLVAATDAVLDYAERQTRAALAALPDITIECEDVLEAGTVADDEGEDLRIALRIEVAGDRLTLDFTGTAAMHIGNLNCPLAVTHSACYFAVRALFAPDVPACAGAYRPIDVIAPSGTLVNARRPAAVAAGNVETSSRIADMVLHAFGHAQSQGTMNNLTLGNDEFTYYETIGGGQGACPETDGPSAVHVAMSNTLNTPVEALELELPLRVVEYAIRQGSGGGGRHHGGDGVVREIEALEPMRYSLIAERRRHAPRGAQGGADGAPGRDSAAGRPIPSKSAGALEPGQSIRIETPGGGATGSPDQQ